MDSPKNCKECRKDKSCKSWYGGSMCTEVKDSMYNATKDARNKIIEEVKRK